MFCDTAEFSGSPFTRKGGEWQEVEVNPRHGMTGSCFEEGDRERHSGERRKKMARVRVNIRPEKTNASARDGGLR